MALVTFMSDFGLTDHYVAAVKARLLRVNPSLQIVDISHQIEQFSIIHAAHVLGQVYADFPPGTVHLIAVGSHNERDCSPVAVKLDEHFFVGPDNGIISLVSEKPATAVVDLTGPAAAGAGSFPARDVYAEVAAKLASGAVIQDFGKRKQDIHRFTNRQMRATHEQISGVVMHIDHFGNLHTNIHRSAFDDLQQGRAYYVQVGRERFQQVHTHYCQVENGECFILFNSNGFLEIGINKGHASQLLGIGFDYPIHIRFE